MWSAHLLLLTESINKHIISLQIQWNNQSAPSHCLAIPAKTIRQFWKWFCPEQTFLKLQVFSPCLANFMKYQLKHGSQSPWKTKIPVFCLYFPCIILVFPVFFCDKITTFKTLNNILSTSCNNFFCHYFAKFPVFFSKIFNFPVFPCLELLFTIFLVFHVE